MIESCFQNALRLRKTEDTLLAEDIAELSKTMPGNVRDHLLGDEPFIGRAILPILWRNLMRAHESRHQFAGMLLIQFRDRLERFDLILQRETVPTLDLNGGDTHGEHPIKSSSC